MTNLTKLRIHRFRRVQPNTELHFTPSLNIVLGRNGAGKTTLLNLVAMVLRSDFSEILTEEFVIEYELLLPAGGITVVVGNRAKESKVPASLPVNQEEAAIRLATESGSVEQTCEVRIKLTDAAEVVVRGTGTELTLERSGQPPERRTTPAMLNGNLFFNAIWPFLNAFENDSVMVNALYELSVSATFPSVRRFDESLDCLRDTTESQTFFFWQPPNGSAVFPPLSAGPVELLQAIGKRLSENPEEDAIRFSHQELGFLKEAVDLLGFASAELKADRLERVVSDAVNKFTHVRFGKLKFDFTRNDGSAIDHARLSYGQKRMLMFLYYLASNKYFVVADELVNGLHHEWIDACMAALGTRQAFMTSQNPLLLDYLPFSSPNHARSSFILCKTALLGTRERLVWSHMSQKDADAFFNAYKIGIEHVSEILRTRGMW